MVFWGVLNAFQNSATPWLENKQDINYNNNYDMLMCMNIDRFYYAAILQNIR